MNRILIGIDGSQSRRAVRKELKRARRLGAQATFVVVCGSTEGIQEARARLDPAMAEAERLGVDAFRLLILRGEVAETGGHAEERELARTA